MLKMLKYFFLLNVDTIIVNIGQNLVDLCSVLSTSPIEPELMKVLQFLYICGITYWVSVVTFTEKMLYFSPLYAHIKLNYAHNSENIKLIAYPQLQTIEIK